MEWNITKEYNFFKTSQFSSVTGYMTYIMAFNDIFFKHVYCGSLLPSFSNRRHSDRSDSLSEKFE